MILILSAGDDLHAAVIRGHLLRIGYPECHVIACDHVADRNPLSLSLTARELCGTIRTSEGGVVRVADCRLLWLRRVSANQSIDVASLDQRSVDLINNDCRSGLLGLLSTTFSGKWVSTPGATTRACDKVLQLATARACGFRVPDTLMSQDRDEVVEFHRRHRGQIVVKTLAGADGAFLLTRFVREPEAMDEAVFAVCPALYQEYIPGSRHIRLNCFGERSYAALIESDALDWRPNLNVPIRSWAVPDALHVRVRRVLDRLGLEMGVIDLKQTPEGDFVWLEVNPQGQFLFLDAVTDLDLASRFAEYLAETAASA